MVSKAKKLSCWHAVEAALKSGDLVRPPVCDRCGQKAPPDNPLQAHHADYDQPLCVEWLCKRCHMVEHHGGAVRKKDNSTLRQKSLLRQKLLAEIDDPVVLETHGGAGKLFLACYKDVAAGIVFEKEPVKTAILAQQRPAWLVYECDSRHALASGVGARLQPDFFDLDPYGDPWPFIDCLLAGGHYRPVRMALAVNDGLRQKLKLNGGWSVRSMRQMVERHGNNSLYANYLEICRENMAGLAQAAGYHLVRWAGYYCGHVDQMTHYAAVLER